MLVKTKITLIGEKAGDFPWQYDKPDKIFDIKEIEIKYCCKPMEEAFQENFIGFGEFNIDRPLNRNNNVNIFHCSPFPEGPQWEELAIKVCPWCKEEIQVQNIGMKQLKKKD